MPMNLQRRETMNTSELYFDLSIETETRAILEVARVRLGNAHHAAKRAITDAISVLNSEMDRSAGMNLGKRGRSGHGSKPF